MCATKPPCRAPDLTGRESVIMVRLISVFFVLALLVPPLSPAQEDKELFHEAVGVRTPKLACETLQNIPLKSLERDIDVLSYDVFLDLYDGLVRLGTDEETPAAFNATVDIRLVVLTDTLTSVPLHADLFTIDITSAFVNGSRATLRRSKGRQRITPPFALRIGDTLSLHIVYTVNRVPGGGLVVVNGKELTEAQGAYPIAFTFSQPENSRRWFPCNDVPNDKAFFRARARVPNGNRLVSNGELLRTTLDGDTARIDVWSSPDVMPPYLFTMNASKFTQLYQLYSRADGTGVPIRNFHWDTDEAGVFKAPYAVRNIPAMFAAFEPRFGRYPFTTYGHVAVHPINIGGMEHQTMTTVSRKWLEGNIEVGYAHELGHQWLGDLVTCATWGDIWLNEGGATFSEALWREHIEGAAGYRAQMMRRRSKYMEQGQNAPSVWDIPIGNLFNEATTYAKASWIYHMMRRMLGDEQFFTTLQLYFKTYRGQSIQTAQFESFWKEQIPNPPIQWNTFFDQWLVQRGHPVFWVRLQTTNDNGEQLRVHVDQVQTGDNIPNVFHALVGLRLYSNGVVVAERDFIMKERTTSFTIDGSFAIDSIQFDPNMLTLHESITDVTVGVGPDSKANTQVECTQCPTLRVVGANPVPANADIILGIGNAPVHTTLRLLDIRGQEVWKQIIDVAENVVRISNTQLSSGAYVAVLTSQWGSTTTRIFVQ